jgi:hypothetical protein
MEQLGHDWNDLMTFDISEFFENFLKKARLGLKYDKNYRR